MIGRLNHVGVAVPSIEAAKKTYRDLYGVPESAITETRELPAQGVKFAFVNIANSQIELIEPLGENSPIAKFIEKNPRGGQHHICFEVQDIYVARDEMVVRGARVLNEPRIGAHGTPIIFIDPKNSDGVLIELMETPKDAHG
ncbi:methylmalonyl-CoA epimerase [Candidatus Viadribacter manganicus]|uniref:Methylmalonyl-CoA epimerase n=1 Tax=Candidatus Viadribacter manganicus TaxID=1759059 RepID=A0A1B1ADD4_9PROT|nr:methylmalonyl-CoA epimerase [Candidatus Viadribacter manganicus]ANP44567.1 methylmalonyl-CoA epimerase [Candidatus Viadribacter manganicus]